MGSWLPAEPRMGASSADRAPSRTARLYSLKVGGEMIGKGTGLRVIDAPPDTA